MTTGITGLLALFGTYVGWRSPEFHGKGKFFTGVILQAPAIWGLVQSAFNNTARNCVLIEHVANYVAANAAGIGRIGYGTDPVAGSSVPHWINRKTDGTSWTDAST